MRPIQTPDSNVNLTLPGAEPMPAERCRFRNPQPPHEISDGFETTWVLDEGEQRAVANGAPVTLQLWGRLHPPVVLRVGDPPADQELEPLVNLGHVFRAVGRLYQLLMEASGMPEGVAGTLLVSAIPDEAAVQEAVERGELPQDAVLNVPGQPCPAEAFLTLWETALQQAKTT